MKNQIVLWSSKINTTHIQLVIMLVALALLVLGSGAVEDFGHIGR